MIGVINSFRGEYAFLSNYDTAPFPWRGIMFQSGEQAFAYAKTFHAATNKEVYQQKILTAQTPGEAKKFGRMCSIHVPIWDERKVHYMREIVHAKFGYVPDYAGKLINTGFSPLVEGNTWGDKFWGKVMEDGKVVGLNMLGTILMEERGYWLWYGQANSDVIASPLTAQQVERTADYG
jgi:ribA/ribD-fused uncharacterized protein